MSEMIERVAIAMSEAMAKPHLDPWEHAARAAIQAMRQPSAVMIFAGDIALDSDCRCECSPERVWPAMIDAALRPPE